MKPETFQRNFLLILTVSISLLFLWMIKSFLITLLFAAVFSSLMRPLYLRFLSTFKKRESLSAASTLAVFVLVILVPLFGFLGLVVNEAFNVTRDVAPWVQSHIENKGDLYTKLQTLPGYRYVEPHQDEIINRIGGIASGIGNATLHAASAITAGTLVLVVNFAIMLYAMFFFFLKGPDVLDKILYYIPLKHADERKLVNGFRSMARATIKGIVVIGIVQGGLAGAALWIAGVPSSLFWSTVMAVLSVIPNVGTAIIWGPACIYLFIKGHAMAAVLVLVWCALVVGSVDNVLRPLLIGKDTQVNELLILLSTLGGLSLWGLSGFILGPALALMFLLIWEIYGHVFKDVLPAVGEIPNK